MATEPPDLPREATGTRATWMEGAVKRRRAGVQRTRRPQSVDGGGALPADEIEVDMEV